MTTKRLVLAICVVAGCGGDKTNHLADAPNAPPDSPPDAPPMGPVTLSVTSQGAAAVGVQVYFQNPDQSLVASPLTDVNGDATATIQIGAFVTAIDPPSPPVATFGGSPTESDSLHTWAGVKPGDHLHLDLFRSTTVTNAAVSVVAPTDPMATTYSLYTSCGNGQLVDITPQPVGSGFVAVGNQPVSVNLPVCAATQDVLVVTGDAEGVPVNSFFLADVAISDDMTLDFSDQTYATVDTTTLDYSNINVPISSVGINELVLTGKGRLFLVTGAANVDGTTANTSIPIPSATNSVVLTVSDIVASDVVSEQLILDWGPLAAAYALDLGGALLHGYATLPTFDATNHDVNWTETAGVSADFVLTQYHSFRPDATLAHDWVWTLAAPRGMAAIATYPRIPTDVFDFNTTATDSSDVRSLVNVKVPGGYDMVRTLIMDVDLGNPDSVVLLGATGHAVVETVAPPPGLLNRHLRRRRH